MSFSALEMAPGGVGPFITGEFAEVYQDFHCEALYDLCPDLANHMLGYVNAQDYVDAHENGTDDQLLLQIDSEDAADMNWGDCEPLIFIMHKDELAKRDFSNVRVYMSLG